MNDEKMTESAGTGTPAVDSQRVGSVVQALDHNVWSEAGAENKIRAKLREFAAELHTIKSNKRVL